MASAAIAERRSRCGTFANGMEYLTWGSGPKTLLYIQGGPGSVVPRGGMSLHMFRRMLDPYAKAGYAVWIVTRRRNMRAGHTIAGMADDYAQVITEEFGGWVDLVVGESTGGLIAQYLAVFHAGSFGHLALVVTGAVLPDWGWDFDSRWGASLARGDTAGAGTVAAEILLPGKSMRWVRQLIGPIFGRFMFAGFDCPPGDILVEAQAEDRSVAPPVAGLLTLRFDAGRFPPTPAACYRAPWRLPGPDSHRLATASLRPGHGPTAHLLITGRTPESGVNEDGRRSPSRRPSQRRKDPRP